MNEALWLLGRGAGVATLVLLTASVALGVLTAGRYVTRGLPRFALTEIHRRAALAASLMLVIHMVSLWLDPLAELKLVDLVVPFLNACNPLWWGLGTLALDLLAVVVVTSMLRKHLPYGVWRGLNWLSYGTWPLAFLHALGGDTDAAQRWLRAVAFLCLLVIASAAAYRLRGLDQAPQGRRLASSPSSRS